MREVRLNTSQKEELHEILESIHGIGNKTVSKIITERKRGGDYLSSNDFNRRLKGLTWERINTLCKSADVYLSLAASDKLRHTQNLQPSVPTDTAAVTQVNPDKGTKLTICTWNACRLSPRASYYETKLDNLFRLIEDSQLDVLALQEVINGTGSDIIKRLSSRFDCRWRELRHNTDEKDKRNGLCIIFNAEKVSVKPYYHKQGHERFSSRKLQSFHRMPQVAFLYSKGGKVIASLLNVHLKQLEPRKEIHRLASVTRKLKEYSGKDIMHVVLGDFNINSDARSFDHLRKQGFVELVRPGKDTKLGYDTTDQTTTIGGSWFDNIWISESMRKQVRDGWCFEFGGRCRSLTQSGHEHASQKRALSSDHLPVVAVISVMMEGRRYSDKKRHKER